MNEWSFDVRSLCSHMQCQQTCKSNCVFNKGHKVCTTNRFVQFLKTSVRMTSYSLAKTFLRDWPNSPFISYERLTVASQPSYPHLEALVRPSYPHIDALVQAPYPHLEALVRPSHPHLEALVQPSYQCLHSYDARARRGL